MALFVLYQSFLSREVYLRWIRFIGLIKNVLKALKPELKRLKNLLWGRGTGIFRLGYEYFWGRGTGICVLKVKGTHCVGLRAILPFFLSSNLYSKTDSNLDFLDFQAVIREKMRGNH